MARAMKDLTHWTLPYSAKIVGEQVDENNLVITMQVRLRWWHPRLWWIAIQTLRGVQ